MAVIRDIVVPQPHGNPIPAVLALPTDLDGHAGGGVVVVHELLGVNDDMRRIAGRFADAGYPALVPDFLSGLGPKPICIARFASGIGKVGTGEPYRRLAVAQAFLGGHPAVAGGPIGVAGFCIGGGFAILYAAGAEVAVVAPFYAAVPKDRNLLHGICPTVASYGGRDRVFGPEAARLDAALTEMGVDHDVKVYSGAGHAFMSPHRGLTAGIGRLLPTHNGYDEAAAQDAWRRTLDFFGRRLGVPSHG